MIHCGHVISAATWKIFLYADSSDNLSDMIIKNITDIIRGKPNDTVDFMIQLHAYYMTGLRYRVTAQGLAFIEEIQLSDDNQQNFINGAQWAFANNSADYTMLIISNHGWGILDPQWNEQAQEWQVHEGGLSNNCMIEKSSLSLMNEQHNQHKGFLFTAKPRSYLANPKLFEGLSYITTHILNNKLDIIAFDTCMGDMLEIGYGVAPYADYLVGSQSCSLPDGFAYQGIIEALNHQHVPRDIAKAMVQAFDSYYKQHDKSGIYTHAALDLSQIYTVCKALNTIIDNLLTMPEFASAMLKACNNSPRFCLWPMYTDGVAWAKNVQYQLTLLPQPDAINTLHSALQNFYQSAAQLVVAQCGGHSTLGLAHGFAIYLPNGTIDDSYYTTSFAQESQWVTFLEFIQHI
jgi:hypothetical protein